MAVSSMRGSLAIMMATVSTPSLSAATSPLQREIAVWNAVKTKRMDVFAASLAPSFVGMYAFGRHNRADELRVVRNQTLRSFALANFRVVTVGPSDMLVTYTAD